jgi:hypothetical protein
MILSQEETTYDVNRPVQIVLKRCLIIRCYNKKHMRTATIVLTALLICLAATQNQVKALADFEYMPVINRMPPITQLPDPSSSQYDIDVTSSVESAINTLISGAPDKSKISSSYTAALNAKPSSSEMAAGKASLPAAPMMAASPTSTSSRPISIMPRYRRRLRCVVNYWPNWKICCWFVWWWWW